MHRPTRGEAEVDLNIEDEEAATNRDTLMRLSESIAMGRLNYDLGQFDKALEHFWDADWLLKVLWTGKARQEEPLVRYYLYKSYLQASKNARRLFADQVKPPHLEGLVAETHPTLVWLGCTFGRFGVRLYDFFTWIAS